MVNVTFNMEEASVISGSLVESGIKFPFECFINCTFPMEILSKIKKIVINNARLENLEFLTQLPNLEELVISNLDYQKVADYLDYYIII